MSKWDDIWTEAPLGHEKHSLNFWSTSESKSFGGTSFWNQVRERRCKYHANGCPEIFTRDNKKHGWWRYHKHAMPGKCGFEIGLEPPPLERDTKEVKMVWLTNLRVILLLYEPSRKRKQKVLWNVLYFYLVFHIYESQPKRKRRKGKGTSLRVKIEPT